jgi:hypothetical protein
VSGVNKDGYRSSLEHTNAASSKRKRRTLAKAIHVGLAFAVPIAWFFSSQWLAGHRFPIGEDERSFINPVQAAAGFILGFAFAKSSPFPFRGWVGYVLGHFVVCMYDVWPWWNWFPVAMFASVIMAVSPCAGELLGIGFGKAIHDSLTRARR